MSPSKSIFIAAVGIGGVGQAFLGQLSHIQQRLSQGSSPVDLRLILARRSKQQAISQDYTGLDPATVTTSINTPNTSFPELLDYLAQAPGRVILVDNTSDLDLAKAYPDVLTRGISIVTASKKAFSDTHDLWQRIFAAAANGSGPATAGYVFHESSCAAGLPVLSTLRELIDTGDRVRRIEGVFSGTMSFLFNAFMPVGGGGGAFSAEVQQAKALGYTEPDPRDDLNGLDVARKLTILARIAGLPVESPTAFPVQSLIPAALETCASAEDFMARLPDHDDEMGALRSAAAEKGKVLRFVGSIDVPAKQVRVGLEEFDPSHPIAALKGSDNILNFHTERYASPMIIQGAGAGGEVTAMGVSGDLLKVVRLLQ